MKFFLGFLWWFCGLVSVLAAPPKLHWKPLDEPGSGGWLTSIAVDPKDGRRVLLGGDMLGIGHSNNGGDRWEPTFGTLSYEIANFTYNPKNPQEVWAGTMSGPHVSFDGGVHWEPRRAGLPEPSGNSYVTPIQQIFLDPKNPDRLLAFGGSWRGWESPGETKFGWIWESLDHGKTWHEYSTVKRYRNIRWAAAAAGSLDVLYACVLNKGLYKSGDSGKTWEELSGGLPSKKISQVATHPTDPNILWASFDNDQPDPKSENFPGGIWKSLDAGKTWQAANGGLSQRKNSNGNFASRYGAITVSPSNPQILYTSDTVWDVPAIYRSENGGDTWTAIFTNQTRGAIGTAYPAGLGATVITVDPQNADIVYAAGSETVIKSTDGGKSWVDQTSEKVPPGADANAPRFWKGRGYSGLCSLVVRFNPRNPGQTAVVAMDAGRLWLSDDGEKTWRFAEKGFTQPWGGGRDVAFAGPGGKIILGAFGQHGGQGDVGLSNDGGLTWTLLGKPGSGLPPSGKGEASAAYLLPDDPDKMWVVYNGTLYHSTDRGLKWTVQIEKDCSRLTADPKTPTTFYVAGGFGVQKTTDGLAYKLIQGAPSAYVVAVDAQNPQVLYTTQNHNGGGGVWKYDGSAWKKILDDERVSGIAVDPTDGNRIIVSTNRDPYKDVCDATGAWISEDGGKTWSNEKEGLACLRGWDVAINPHDPGKVYFCSLGRGFFVARWPKK